MRSLPLYQDDLLEVEKTEPLPKNPRCQECPMGGQGDVTCMFPAQRGHHQVLVIGESPRHNYASVGEPFVGGPELKVKRLLASYGQSVMYDYAVKCPGKPVEFAADKCRPYLYQTFLDCTPERVILIGRTAQEAFLGRAYNAWLVRRGYVSTLDGVPVFCLPDLYEAVENKVLRRWFKEDLAWAMTSSPSLTPYDGLCHVVETAQEARTACDVIRERGVVVADVETYGRMYTDEYKIVVLAATYPDSNSAWVWNEDALLPGDPRSEPLKTLLAEVPVAAHSADTEYRAIGQYLGVEIELVHDTKASSKLMNPDGPADLDSVSGHVGMGGHKWEAKEDLATKEKVLSGLRTARTKPVVTEWGEEIKLDKNGRKMRRKVPLATREPSLAEQVEAIKEAWVKPRTINKVKNTYANLAKCELTDDWVMAALTDGEPKAYAYGLMDRELCMRYCATDTVACARKVTRDMAVYDSDERVTPIKATYHEVLVPIVQVASRMMNNGLLIDQEALGTFETFLDQKIAEFSAAIHEHAPGLNPGSADQVREYLYNSKAMGGLGLSVVKMTKGGKSGNKKPATDAKTLVKMRDEHPVVQLLVDYAEVTKLQSNYARGLRPHITDDGRIHCYLNVTGAATGRWTANQPNLQTLPSRGQYAKMAKMLYISPPGYKLVAADFSTLEVRVAAYRSGDKVMIELLNSRDSKGNYLDFHFETAKGISTLVWGNSLDDCGFGYTLAELLAEHGGDQDLAKADLRWKPLEEEIARRRAVAKQINFSLIYGQGTETLADRIGCSVEEAERAKDAILGRFRGLRDWMAQQMKDAHHDGGIWTMWGMNKSRFRHIVDIGYNDRKRVGHGERVAVNTPVQGEGSDFNTVSLIHIDRWLRSSDFDAKLLLAVHDSNVAEVREDCVEDYARKVVSIMGSHQSFGVPILVDVDQGDAYGAMSKLKVA